MIDVDEFELLKNNFSTFKDASCDDCNSEYMTDSEFKIIDFDAVKDSYLEQFNRNNLLKSNDALMIKDDNIIFIEFKNGSITNSKNEIDKVKRKKIEDKIYHSMLILMDITKMKVSDFRNNGEYILVYNEEKNTDKNDINVIKPSKNRDWISDTILKKSKKEFVKFGFEKYMNIFFKDVHTYTEEEFQTKFLSKLKVQ